MMASISSLFGYVLNYIYDFVLNYGFAIIIFSILLKLLLLPLSIRQQKNLKKTAKIQEKVNEIKEKYKNDQNKMNQEMMELYKKERPSMGCSSLIIQMVILLAIFTLVRSPITYMKKIDDEKINYVRYYIKKQGISINERYPQVSILDFVSKNRETITINTEEMKSKSFEMANNSYNNVLKLFGKEAKTEDIDKMKEQLQKEKNKEIKIDLEELYINTNFLSLDLSKVPLENLQNIKVYIIPVLYVLTSIISMRITTKTTNNTNKKEEKTEKSEQEEMSAQMGKSMTWFMPMMSISISLIAPLGLALYWLINNILMILERVVINKVLSSKEGEEEAQKNG